MKHDYIFDKETFKKEIREDVARENYLIVETIEKLLEQSKMASDVKFIDTFQGHVTLYSPEKQKNINLLKGGDTEIEER